MVARLHTSHLNASNLAPPSSIFTLSCQTYIPSEEILSIFLFLSHDHLFLFINTYWYFLLYFLYFLFFLSFY